MSLRETLQIGDLRLKQPNQKVENISDPKVKQIVDDLVDTMRNNGLIGMAAPQIGENYCIFVTEPRETANRPADQADELRVYINPEITYNSEEVVEIYEGCGRVANGTIFAPVVRPKEITVIATDLNGKKFTITCDGILARVIQHEDAHLHGSEFLDLVTDNTRIISDVAFRERFKNDPKHIASCQVNKKEVQE